MLISVCFGEGEFTEKLQFNLIFNELEEKFMQSIFQPIVKDKLFSPTTAGNFPDSLIFLWKS